MEAPVIDASNIQQFVIIESRILLLNITHESIQMFINEPEITLIFVKDVFVQLRFVIDAVSYNVISLMLGTSLLCIFRYEPAMFIDIEQIVSFNI